MSTAFLFAGAFLASAVEMVEALTIVLAVGVTRDWLDWHDVRAGRLTPAEKRALRAGR